MIERLDNLQIPYTPGKPLVIAGPCSAETHEQTLKTAMQLAKQGVKIFRAGVWKPRTKPGGFEGMGKEALEWLKEVKEKTGMLTATEVATPSHVELALSHNIDILWIGARTSGDPFALETLANALRGCDIPILVKNPMIPDTELWIGAIERFKNAGIKRLGGIHRGFSNYANRTYRNAPMWQIPIELRHRIPDIPLICDPSHIAGRRDLVSNICEESMNLGFDGVIIECHCNPDIALSDKHQQITPGGLGKIIEKIKLREGKSYNEDIIVLRNQIDDIDDELLSLLARRMEISRQIGEYKKSHNISALQAERYYEILGKRVGNAKSSGMSEDFICKIYETIHQESLRQQLDIINGINVKLDPEQFL